MLTNLSSTHPDRFSIYRLVVPLLIALLLLAASARAQTKEAAKWESYRDVKLGMTIQEVYDLLGKPKSEDSVGLFYVFSDTENAQFLVDANGKIRTISAVFEGDNENAPSFEAVFGVAPEAGEVREDGSIFKMQRYPAARYWVSFNKMTGSGAMTVVIIQKF